MNTKKLPVLVDELSHWIRNQLVAEVPADLAVCEFECRKTECSLDEWVCCERRLSRAAGEPRISVPCPERSLDWPKAEARLRRGTR